MSSGTEIDGFQRSVQEEEEEERPSEIPRSHLWLLYVSHSLSTWNMRSYEFAAVSCSH